MKVIYLYFSIFFSISELTLGAQPYRCADLFNGIEKLELKNSETFQKEKLIKVISQKLLTYFGKDWQKDQEDFDKYSANWIYNFLKRFGSDLDWQILDSYLNILIHTRGKYEMREIGTFYIDLYMGQRPKSIKFRELHWDWSIFKGYFSTNPSVLALTKQQDLSYLKEIENRVLMNPGTMTLREAQVQTNEYWHSQYLKLNDPKLAYEYESYLKSIVVEGNSPEPYLDRYHVLYNRFAIEVAHWKMDTHHRQGRFDSLFYEHLGQAIENFKNSHSSFDLFLFEKYFQIIRRTSINEANALKWTNKKIQLTNWTVFSEGLPFGSVEYLVDFLFQNAQDTSLKIFLLKILNKVDELTAHLKNKISINKKNQNRSLENDFSGFFMLARVLVENEMKLGAIPSIYQSDLHIFTLSGQFSENPAKDSKIIQMNYPQYNEIFVHWNSILESLQSAIINTFSLEHQEDLRINSIKTLKTFFQTYFNNLRKDQTVSEELISQMEKEEMESTLARSTVFAFTDPQSTKLLALVRIFDGSHLNFQKQEDQLHYKNMDSRLPIMQMFPQIQIPELETNEYVLEIGRVFASKEVIANSYDIMMNRIAEYFEARGMKGIIYLSSPAAMSRYNQKKGATVVYTPDQLKEYSESKDSVYILKISIDEFIKRFHEKNYRSVPLRKN